MLGFRPLAAGPLASGAFGEAAINFEWFAHLSEPYPFVRGSRPEYQAQFWWPSHELAPSAASWFMELSRPTPPLAGLQTIYQAQFQWPSHIIPPRVDWWFWPLSEPPPPLPGLGVVYQLAFTSPPRVIPSANVITIAAIETNNDIFRASIDVGGAGPPVRAVVSIEEIPAIGDAATSIREP